MTYSLFTQDSAVFGPEVETGTRSADNRNNNMYGESHRFITVVAVPQYWEAVTVNYLCVGTQAVKIL